MNGRCAVSIPPSVAKALWSQGYPLQEAANRAAPHELMAQPARPGPSLDQAAISASPFEGGWAQKTLAVATGLAVALEPAMDHMQAITEIRTAIRENLLDLIWDGAVVAIGYVVPRSIGDFPVIIPIDVLEGDIDWPNSAISGNDLQFVAVRIVPRKLLEKYLANFESAGNPALLIVPSKSEDIPASKGRWNAKAKISEVFADLIGAGKINLSGDKSANYPLIRNSLIQKFPEMRATIKALSNETIRQATKVQFDCAKAAMTQ